MLGSFRGVANFSALSARFRLLKKKPLGQSLQILHVRTRMAMPPVVVREVNVQFVQQYLTVFSNFLTMACGA